MSNEGAGKQRSENDELVGLLSLLDELDGELAKTVAAIESNPDRGKQIARDFTSRVNSAEAQMTAYLERYGMDRHTSGPAVRHFFNAWDHYGNAGRNLEGYFVFGTEDWYANAATQRREGLGDRNALAILLGLPTKAP